MQSAECVVCSVMVVTMVENVEVENIFFGGASICEHKKRVQAMRRVEHLRAQQHKELLWISTLFLHNSNLHVTRKETLFALYYLFLCTPPSAECMACGGCTTPFHGIPRTRACAR